MLFRFTMSDLRPLIRHARESPEHRLAYGESGPGGHSLWLVRDQGVYLMSNGSPILPRGDEGSDSFDSRVVYASGYGPGSHVAGDDFVETLPLKAFDDLGDAMTVEIEVGEHELVIRGYDFD